MTFSIGIISRNTKVSSSVVYPTIASGGIIQGEISNEISPLQTPGTERVEMEGYASIREARQYTSIKRITQKVISFTCSSPPISPMINSVTSSSGYSLSTTHTLSWSKCVPSYSCCGPLKYHVYENGKEVKTTRLTSCDLADRKEGKRYVYWIIAEDAFGNFSEGQPYVCDIAFVAYGEAPDLTKVYRLILAVVFSVVAISITTTIFVRSVLQLIKHRTKNTQPESEQ